MTDVPVTDVPRPVRPELGAWPAAALVFGSSAAVLVVELVALRLLAPYLGLTLETSTMVIGLALTAIASGHVGRRLDRPTGSPPRRAHRTPAGCLRGGRRCDAVRSSVARRPVRVQPAADLVAALTIIVPGRAALRRDARSSSSCG